jgi:hypothetical protein
MNIEQVHTDRVPVCERSEEILLVVFRLSGSDGFLPRLRYSAKRVRRLRAACPM